MKRRNQAFDNNLASEVMIQQGITGLVRRGPVPGPRAGLLALAELAGSIYDDLLSNIVALCMERSLSRTLAGDDLKLSRLGG